MIILHARFIILNGYQRDCKPLSADTEVSVSSLQTCIEGRYQ